MEDQEIIELFFARSERAIGEVDAKYGRICRSFSCRIVNDRRDAEECVNDAYLGAWNTIPPERPNPLLTYLCRIVRNLSLKCVARKCARKRKGNYDLALQELEETLSARNTVETEFELRELTRILETFLDALSAENRWIFLRRYWFFDSCRDIAVQMGAGEKAVTVRLVRLRQKLKQYLLEQGVSL